MKKVRLLLLFLVCYFPLQAQINLLRNGGFEQDTACPEMYDQIACSAFWNGIDTTDIFGSAAWVALGNFLPEYINTCSASPYTSAPDNHNFYHWPRTGNAMVASIMYYDYGDSGFSQYNYFQGRLVSYLISGRSYCVTFYVTKAPSQYSVNKIGAYLDDGTIDTAIHTPGLCQSQYTPQIYDTNIVNDTFNWTKIQGSFVANGTEKFITIGEFFDTGNNRHISYAPRSNDKIGYYLTDDVSVIATDATASAGNDTTIRPGDTVTLGPAINGDGMPCYWYKLGSSLAIDSGGNTRVHPDTTTSYVVVMDLCGNVTMDTVKVTVLDTGMHHISVVQLHQFKNVTIYPNPTSLVLNIENAKGCSVVFCDVVGSAVLRATLVADNEVLDISRLEHGVYFVRVEDGVTGEWAVRKVLKE